MDFRDLPNAKDLKEDLGLPLADPPQRTQNASFVAGMHRLTVEHMEDGYRARLTCTDGHEATYSGLREVVAWDGDDWSPIPVEEGLVQHDRDEGDLYAQLGADGVLRVWEHQERCEHEATRNLYDQRPPSEGRKLEPVRKLCEECGAVLPHPSHDEEEG